MSGNPLKVERFGFHILKVASFAWLTRKLELGAQ